MRQRAQSLSSDPLPESLSRISDTFFSGTISYTLLAYSRSSMLSSLAIKSRAHQETFKDQKNKTGRYYRSVNGNMLIIKFGMAWAEAIEITYRRKFSPS